MSAGSLDPVANRAVSGSFLGLTATGEGLVAAANSGGGYFIAQLTPEFVTPLVWSAGLLNFEYVEDGGAGHVLATLDPNVVVDIDLHTGAQSDVLGGGGDNWDGDLVGLPAVGYGPGPFVGVARLQDGSLLASVLGGRTLVVDPDGIVLLYGLGSYEAQPIADTYRVDELPISYAGALAATPARDRAYMSDPERRVVWEVDPETWIAMRFAGVADAGFVGVGSGAYERPESSGDGGPALDAVFHDPMSLAVGPDGEVYIGDGTCIRVVRDGTIDRFAGDCAVGGVSGDGGPAVDAKIGNAEHMAVYDGFLYFTEGDGTIRRIWLP